jgi:hypothetical protein
MCTKPNFLTGNAPMPFETFRFFIQPSPEHEFEIYNLPNMVMFKASNEAGYNWIIF